jgi:hypothetical protein
MKIWRFWAKTETSIYPYVCFRCNAENYMKAIYLFENSKTSLLKNQILKIDTNEI